VQTPWTEITSRIVRATHAPVAADIEVGNGEIPGRGDEIGGRDHSGWCGRVKLEDRTPHRGTPIRHAPEAADPIRAAHEAGRAARAGTASAVPLMAMTTTR
jgi:2-methylisocitrate lyase-like PEP mutase family enzyme